jgi:hypothetical protein
MKFLLDWQHILVPTLLGCNKYADTAGQDLYSEINNCRMQLRYKFATVLSAWCRSFAFNWSVSRILS